MKESIRQCLMSLALGLGLSMWIASVVHSGGIMVTPARIEMLLPEDGLLPPVFVQNRGEQMMVVQASTGWGTHDMWGQPIYDSAIPGNLTVDVTPEVLKLGPGQRGAFQVTVHPVNESMYPVLFVSLMPADESATTLTRIAVPMLLATPHSLSNGRIETLWVEPDHQQGELVLHAIVENSGESHLRTDGKLQLFRTDGHIIVEVDMPSHLVLPGARRQVATRLDASELAEGEYHIVLDTQLAFKGDSPIRFAIGPNQNLQLLDSEYATLLALGGSQP